MKVLFTTNIPSPYRVDFFNEFGKLCDLTVVFEKTLSKCRDKNWKSDKFTNFNAIFLSVGTKDTLCTNIKEYIKDKSYDIIIVGMYSSPTSMYAINYMKRHHIKFILSSDGGFISNDSNFKYKIKSYFISAATAWLSTGKATSEYLSYYGADSARIFNYPFTSLKSIDILDRPLSDNEKLEYKRKLGIKESTAILSVGQFIYRKGYDILLKACQFLDENTGVYIVGGKPTEEYLNLQKELNLKNVHFVDFIIKDKLSDYYKAADMFVLPTREDIWGLVINEAMAYGLPVVTTERCIAGLELINNGVNGYIIPTDDIEELSTKIKKTLENRIDFSNMSLDIIRQYTIEKMVQAHLSIVNDIGG